VFGYLFLPAEGRCGIHRFPCLICGCLFLGSRTIPYDVGIACTQRGLDEQMPGASDPPRRHDHPEPAVEIRQFAQRDIPDHHDSPVRATADSSSDLRQRQRGLPDGHPSSPNHEDGSPRPPTVDLSKLESAAETDRHEPRQANQEAVRASQPERSHDRPEHEESQQEHADDRASEGWRAALPRLQGLWERHTDRWPTEQQSPADRSTDEPGSWRGDAGHYLNYEENLVTEHALERISKAEPDVSRMMKTAETIAPGIRLVGLQYCLKGEDRFKEKISEECRAMPDRSIGEIARNVPDAVRYTYQLEMEGYVDCYWDLCERVKQHGNEMVLSRNSWNSAQYKGINTRWRTAGGQPFEIQFHTPESFEAKQLTHQAYERIRSPATTSSERRELFAFQAEVSTMIPVPTGAHGVPDYRKDES